MTGEVINRDLLPGNMCFGCGLDNPHGLHIEIVQDETHKDRLVAIFKPSTHTTGFPGIIHGGAIYTAMDCLAAWVPTVLRSNIKAVWVLRSASIKYHRPAPPGQPITLIGMIAQEGSLGGPIVVHTEAHNSKGKLLAEAEFKVIPLAAERFKEVSGIEKLPENWSKLLGERDISKNGF